MVIDENTEIVSGDLILVERIALEDIEANEELLVFEGKVGTVIGIGESNITGARTLTLKFDKAYSEDVGDIEVFYVGGDVLWLLKAAGEPDWSV